jgi:hypothetical protein
MIKDLIRHNDVYSNHHDTDLWSNHKRRIDFPLPAMIFLYFSILAAAKINFGDRFHSSRVRAICRNRCTSSVSRSSFCDRERVTIFQKKITCSPSDFLVYELELMLLHHRKRSRIKIIDTLAANFAIGANFKMQIKLQFMQALVPIKFFVVKIACTALLKLD